MPTTAEIARTPEHVESEIPDHFVFDGVSWSYYERTLEEIGNRRGIRVAYLDGVMELMSPLPEHEGYAQAISDLVKALSDELGIPRKSFGCATFRREDKDTGAEPDASFYFHETASVAGMKRFDPHIHRPPDLWIEVDIPSASIHRESIYARLGVPEVWRYDGKRLTVKTLMASGSYAEISASKIFPSVPLNEFASYIPTLADAPDETAAIDQFRKWVQSL